MAGTIVVTHHYLLDGGEDVIVEDSRIEPSNRRRRGTSRTAACLTIDAAIGAPADARCRIP